MEQRHKEEHAEAIQRHEDLLEQAETITSRLDAVLDELREPFKRLDGRSEP
jgi:hypothetical protein